MQLPSLGISCVAGMPVVRGGQTVPSQGPLCFDPGSPASDRTEGKKKGRPKAENQALRDIPVSSLKAGVGLMLGSACQGHHPAFACFSHTSPKPSACVRGRSVLSGFMVRPGTQRVPFAGFLEQVRYTIAAWGGLNLAVLLRLKGSWSLSALQAWGGDGGWAWVGLAETWLAEGSAASPFPCPALPDEPVER